MSLLLVWAYILYEPLSSLFNILKMTSTEFSRRNVASLLLAEMMRTNDLDTSMNLSEIGISQVQKQSIADFVKLDKDTMSFHTVSRRNPEIARMPRFLNSNVGNRGNILLWANMRCALRYYGDRYSIRMAMFLNASMWAIILGSVLLLIVFSLSRTEYIDLIEHLRDPSAVPMLSNADQGFLVSFSLDAFSPSSVMVVVMTSGYLFFTFINILYAYQANSMYANHYAIINNRMNDVQRYRSRILVDTSFDEESRHSKLTELSNIDRALEVTYDYITDQDKIVYSKAFGLKARCCCAHFLCYLRRVSNVGMLCNRDFVAKCAE